MLILDLKFVDSGQASGEIYAQCRVALALHLLDEVFRLQNVVARMLSCALERALALKFTTRKGITSSIHAKTVEQKQ